MLAKNPSWRLVGIYADEGITGTLVNKREQFLRMIRDCENGKIDKIVTKSIPRFARNAVDCIFYVRKLKKLGISIYFEEENIDSLREESEAYIGIYSIMAQTESENISANVKWGILKRMQNGTYLCHINMLGYRRDKETKEIYIVPKEANIVKMIYDKFLDGYSLREIKKLLEEKKIKTYFGKEVWDPEVIKNILQNEKYVGDIIYQKTFRTDCISKQVKQNNGEKEKYLVKNNHQPIIDREIFNQVQEEFAKRNSMMSKLDKSKTIRGRYSPKYSLNQVLVCGDCGSSFRRKYAKRKDGIYYYWLCINRLDNRDKYCDNHKGLEEISLYATIYRALFKFINENKMNSDYVKSYLIYVLSGESDGRALYQIESKIKDEKERIIKYSSAILQSDTDKGADYIIAVDKCGEIIKQLRIQKNEVLKRLEGNTNIEKVVEKIDTYLNQENNDISIIDDFLIRRAIQ